MTKQCKVLLQLHRCFREYYVTLQCSSTTTNALIGTEKGIFFVWQKIQFKKIKKEKILLINYDEMFITDVMNKALDFWKKTIGKFVLQ